MKRLGSPKNREALAAEIASLAKLPTEELRERWKALSGKPLPPEIGRSLLIRAIAYRVQEQAYGGLKPATRRLLARAVGERARGSARRPPARMAQAGTILIREWRGTAHRVTMLDDGVTFNGKRYRSLSEVARAITGSHWSGPRFFGLHSPVTENHHATS